MTLPSQVGLLIYCNHIFLFMDYFQCLLSWFIVGITSNRVHGLRYLAEANELLAEQPDGFLSIKKLPTPDRVAVALADHAVVPRPGGPDSDGRNPRRG